MSSAIFDDDVPMPKRRGKPARSDRAPEIPFEEFPIGKSFLVRGGGKQATVSGAKAAFERRFPEREFKTRYFDDDPKYHVPGVRIWRLK